MTEAHRLQKFFSNFLKLFPCFKFNEQKLSSQTFFTSIKLFLLLLLWKWNSFEFFHKNNVVMASWHMWIITFFLNDLEILILDVLKVFLLQTEESIISFFFILITKILNIFFEKFHSMLAKTTRSKLKIFYSWPHLL